MVRHSILKSGARAPRQRGVTLVIALMFMVALTLLGVGMVRSTTSEERMGANTRDYDVAFAAAEAALRDAEIRLQGVYVYPAKPASITQFPAAADSCGTNKLATDTTSLIGYCYGITTQPIFTNTSFSLDDTTKAATLGQYTSTPTLQGVSTQPNYYVELLQIPKAGTSGLMTAYRITSKGYGRRSTTQVLLQEVVLY
jgi:type IV pilus assembly protein PilX